MLLKEMMSAMDDYSNSFDKVMAQCDAFVEAACRELETNFKEAELKVLRESGTAEDLVYLESQATEGFIIRAKNTLKKIKDSVIEFIEKIVKSIKDFFAAEKTKKAIDKTQKTIDKNPKFKNLKIKIMDTDKVEKTNNKFLDMVDKKIAMFKAGKFSSKDREELENIDKNYTKEIAIAVGATVTIAVAAALVILNKCDCAKKAEDLKDDVDSGIDLDKGYTADQINVIMKAENLRARIEKSKANFIARKSTNILDAIRSAVTKSDIVDPTLESAVEKPDDKDVEEEQEPVQESTETPLDADRLQAIYDDIVREVEESAAVKESADPDDTEEPAEPEAPVEAQESTETPEKEPTSEGEVTEGADDDSQYVTAEEYLESMEKELFGEDEEVVEESTNLMTAEAYLESMEAEIFGKDDEEEDATVAEESATEDFSAESYLDELEKSIFGEE